MSYAFKIRGLRRLSRALAVYIAVSLGVSIGALMIAASVAGASRSQSSAGIGSSVPVHENVMGVPNAKVSILIYADAQCSHCAYLHREVEPKIIEQYVNTGKAKLEVRQIGLLGNDSQQAAAASDCAALQNRFWDYRDAIYGNFAKLGPGAYSPSQLELTAKNLGLDEKAFNACYEGGVGKAKVQADTERATGDNVKGVPVIIINGRRTEGAYDFDYFKRIIDEELAK